MAFFSSLAKPVLDLALPPRCPICGVIVEADNRFCLACWSELCFIGPPCCSSCGTPFAFEQEAEALCTACLLSPPYHDGVRAVVAYDSHSATVALRLKYGARLGLADLIGQQMMRFGAEMPSGAMIVPVPLHRWRLWSRGFNQSVLIGEALAPYSGCTLYPDALLRLRSTPPLRGMTPDQRRRLMTNLFAVNARIKPLLVGQPVVLIDDVYTSGATANACARTLKLAGASQVMVFCWARVVADAASKPA